MQKYIRFQPSLNPKSHPFSDSTKRLVLEIPETSGMEQYQDDYDFRIAHALGLLRCRWHPPPH